MSYLNEDSVSLIEGQIEYLRGLADGLHSASPVAYNGIREAAELIEAALSSITLEQPSEPSTETPAYDGEADFERAQTKAKFLCAAFAGDENPPEPLATALEDDTEVRKEFTEMTPERAEEVQAFLEGQGSLPTIDATSEVTEQQAIEAGQPETSSQIDEAPKPSYFDDQFS